MSKNADTPTQGVAAVDRALTILNAFEESPEPITLAVLSKKTGLYKSTLLRLIASLQAFGYITRNPDGSYFLGPTLLRLGAAYQRASNLHDRVMPVLRDQFGRHSEVVEALADGRVRVWVAAPSPRSIAEHLAGWGAMVQVEEPESVRLELARIGAELVEHYRALPR